MKYDRYSYRLNLRGIFFLILSGVLYSDFLFAQDRPNLMVEATRISGEITIDGTMDEPEWELAPVISGFQQVEPNQGEPARYDTEVRVLYNDEFIYIGAFNRDDPGEKPRVRDLRRNFDYFQNDLFGVVFDTFNNERDAISFQVTPYGNQRDLQVFDDFVFNRNFDVVWYAETVRADSGWTVEMAIPWSSLRYEEDQGEWGINFVRRHRRSNEESAWSPWPRAYTAYRTSYAGKLTNIEPPDPPLNVRVQPYGLVQADRSYSDNRPDLSPKFGGEIKWSPSRSSVVDLTFNTDFAQADVDQQVINLTRFPVLFPEKRQFFLESANLFELVNLQSLKPFFSRRIGLTVGGEPVPIDAGIRYVDQTGGRSVGGLLMRQRSSEFSPASWFGVGRYQHNFGRNKRAGFMLTSRIDENANGSGFTQNHVGNIDTFIRFTPRVNLSVNLSGSYDELEDKVGHSGDYWVAYRDNLIYAGLIQGVVSSDYRARSGFVSRNDVIITSPAVNLNWRPGWRPSSVRAFMPAVTVFLYHTYSDLTFQEGYVAVRPVGVEFQNGASFGYGILTEWQNLQIPFNPVGIEIEPGSYRYFQHQMTFNSDRSAGVSIGGIIRHGGYFDGELTSIDLSSDLNPTPYFSAGMRFIHNRFRDLGVNSESRNVNLIAPNVRIALNPRIQLTAFWQHNTDLNTNSINTRFSWEFAPLSYLYLVFNDIHPFGDEGLSPNQGNQQAIFKLTYLKQI